MRELHVTAEKLWPAELLYWRTMGAKHLQEYRDKTLPARRLVLIPWGVLEAHGPWLPTGQDSMMAHVVADVVAKRLQQECGVQPILLDSFQDVGSYSATRGFIGALALEGWRHYQPGQPSLILEMWEQVIKRLKEDGFDNFFIINGDGGNWMNYFDRHMFEGQESFESMAAFLGQKYGVILRAINWDQEGVSWPHGSHYAHACVKWVCDFAPDFIRIAALRAGLRSAPEGDLQKLEGDHFAGMTAAERRNMSWADDPRQKELYAVNRFSLDEYRNLLYEGDRRTPRRAAGIEHDFYGKVDYLFREVLEMMLL